MIARVQHAKKVVAREDGLERRLDLDGVRVGTLRRYVEALGGQLDLVGVGIMSDRHLRIAGGAFAVDDRGRKRKVGLGEPSR